MSFVQGYRNSDNYKEKVVKISNIWDTFYSFSMKYIRYLFFTTLSNHFLVFIIKVP